MTNDRRAMYDGFRDKGEHSTEWVRITKYFLNLAFVGDRRVAKFPCKKCGNYKMLPQYDMQGHLAKDGFMPNYLAWHDHGEVEPPATTHESDENEDEDWIDDMIANIRREYDPDYREQLSLSKV
jgi:hypothetical protein